jgi:formamidopyrimidine-DNA glycosylase
MPEIVEVETIRYDLIKSKAIIGHKIKDITILSDSIIEKSSNKDIYKIKNQIIKNINRIGKYLIFELNDFFLIIHLKMTGHIFLKDKNYKLLKHDHAKIVLDNDKEIIYNDTRKFGKIFVKKDLSFLNKLGPDILKKDFSLKYFSKKLKEKNKKIKTLLLDQSFVSGIGNIYADEVLFHAKIDPEKLTKSFSDKNINTLYNSIKKVIKDALIHRGTSLGHNKSNFSSINEDFGKNQDHLLIHTKKICPKCKKKVSKIKINQRTSYYCKNCQKL